MNVILGFKAPTTSGRKNFDDDILCLCVPTTWKYSPHPISIHIDTKGLRRSPPWAKKFWGKNSQGSKGFLRPQEGPREAQGVRGVRGSKRE